MESTKQSHLAVGKKLLGVFAAMAGLVLALVGTYAVYYRYCGGLLDIYARKLYIGSQVELATTEMQGAQRGLMLSYAMKDPAAATQYIDLYATSSRRIDNLLLELRPLLASDVERTALTRITTNRAKWQPRFDRLRQLCESGDIASAYKLRNENKVISAEMHAGASALVSEQKKAREAVQAASNLISNRIALAAALICLTLGTAGAAVVRSTTQQLRRSIVELKDGADKVAAAAFQIASSSREVAQGASEQANDLDRTSAASCEMALMTRRNADRSQRAAAFVNNLGEVVVQANSTLGGMIASMEEITASSSRISQIIRVIDEIASQTKLLSLNAAVEAARAGDAGAGFAVVAAEVRNLAQRSAQAASDTAELIENSIVKSTQGGSRLAGVAASVRAVSESAHKVKELVAGIDSSSREQAQGIERISRAVSRMDSLTKRTVTNARDSAETTNGLREQSERLMAVVGRLSALVGVRPDSTSAAATAR